MTTAQRRYLTIGVITAALVIVVVSRGRDAGPDAAAAAPSATSATSNQGGAPPDVTDLKLDLLRAEHDKLPAAERDLFRFKPKASPPVPAIPRPAATGAPLGPPAPVAPPPPPPIPLRMIGMVEGSRETGRVAVLADTRGNVFYGKEGDIIDGRYRVLSISTDTAELVYLDGRGRQILRLSGQ